MCVVVVCVCVRGGGGGGGVSVLVPKERQWASDAFSLSGIAELSFDSFPRYLTLLLFLRNSFLC